MGAEWTDQTAQGSAVHLDNEQSLFYPPSSLFSFLFPRPQLVTTHVQRGDGRAM